MKENKLVDGSSGVSPLGPSNKMKSAVRKAIKKINKSSRVEMDGLKRLFESKFRLSSGNLFFANSIKELIYLVPVVFNPKRVLIAGPALEIYEGAARSAGAEVTYMPAVETDGFALDMSRIQENIKKSDLVFLANPNRITGKLLSREKIHEAVTVMTSGGPHFVIDESLIDFAGPDNYHADLLDRGNITILRTTAYFYGMPGLELAYAVSSPDVIDLYEKKKHGEINLLSVTAARAAYKDSTYSKASKQYMAFEKKAIVRRLQKIEWIRVFDTDSNIILLKIDKNPEELAQRLRGSGLNIRDCREIIGLDRSFFRISVMKHENNLKLMSALNRLQQEDMVSKTR